VTMPLSSTVMEIWQFEVLPGRLFQEQRSAAGRSSVGPQYYTDLILDLMYSLLRYVIRSTRGVKMVPFLAHPVYLIVLS